MLPLSVRAQGGAAPATNCDGVARGAAEAGWGWGGEFAGVVVAVGGMVAVAVVGLGPAEAAP